MHPFWHLGGNCVLIGKLRCELLTLVVVACCAFLSVKNDVDQATAPLGSRAVLRAPPDDEDVPELPAGALAPNPPFGCFESPSVSGDAPGHGGPNLGGRTPELAGWKSGRPSPTPPGAHALILKERKMWRPQNVAKAICFRQWLFPDPPDWWLTVTYDMPFVSPWWAGALTRSFSDGWTQSLY